MTMYVSCENAMNQIESSPINMVTVTLMNGTVINNVSVYPDGSVRINNIEILRDTPLRFTAPNGNNCSAFFARTNTITISYNVISSIFSQVDPVFFNIYRMMNGDGSRGDFNRTTFSDNASAELTNFYSEMNRTITNMTV